MNLEQFTIMYPHNKPKWFKISTIDGFNLFRILQNFVECKTYTDEGRKRVKRKIIDLKKEINRVENKIIFDEVL